MCGVELFQTLTGPDIPDSPSSWLNLSILIVFNLLNVGLASILGGVFVKIMDNFDVTREEAARTISYYTIAMAFSGIVIGASSHKFGPKKTLVIGTILGVVGCFGSAMVPVSADNLNYLSLCFFIYGISSGFQLGITFELVASHFVSHRGKAIMLYNFFSAINLIIHPSLYSLVLDAFGLRGSWLFYCCFLVQSFVPLHLFKAGKQHVIPKTVPKVIVEDSDGVHHEPHCLERVDTTARKDLELIRGDFQLRFVRSIRNDKCCDATAVKKSDNVTDENLTNERLEIEAEERELLEACATNGDLVDSNKEMDIQVCDSPELEQLPVVNDDQENKDKEVIPERQMRLSERRRLSLRRYNETYCSSLKRILSNYRVYAQLFCQMIGGLSHVLVCNTIVDYGMDKGLTFRQGNRVFVTMCVGGLIGLIPTGFFIDWKGMSDSLKLSLVMFKVVLSYVLLSFCRGFWLYFAAFLVGSGYSMSSTIRTQMASKFGIDSLSTILGFGFFLNGCLQLVTPALVGVCRDGYGSYVYLYIILSISCLTAAILYLSIYINDRRIWIKNSATNDIFPLKSKRQRHLIRNKK